MNNNIGKFYWLGVTLVQVYLILRKYVIEDFYLWNIVALIGAIFFLYKRQVEKTVIITSEISLAVLLGINGIMTFLAQIVNLNNYLILVGSIIVGLISFLITFQLSRIEKGS